MQNITWETLQEVINGTTMNTQEQESPPLYRLVNNFSWYLLIGAGDEVTEFTNGNQFAIAFEDYPDKQFSGTIVGNVSENGKFTYVVEMTEDIGSLINIRRADAQIYTMFDGLKVPESAIIEQNDQQGVNVVIENERIFIPVEVKIISEGQAIVLPLNEGELAVGQEVEV